MPYVNRSKNRSKNRPESSTALVSQAHIDGAAHIGEGRKDWHRAAFRDVAARLGNPDFPCVFSRNALHKQLLKFLFVENAEDSGIRHLAAGLTEYVELS